MDTMQAYKIRESIRDVIRILDSAPLHRDLIYERNAVHLTNRIPIAHLAIERGLKSLLYRAGKTQNQVHVLGHSLNKLYQSLEDCDKESAVFLETAFKDTVDFFGYNVDIKGFGYFRSLYSYLSKVGTDKHFEAMRYWVIEDSGGAENPIHFVCPRTHRELLCALDNLFNSTPKTISQRVERAIRQALTHRPDFVWNSDDKERQRSIEGYFEWLKAQHSYRAALEKAVAQDFVIEADNSLANQTVRTTYNELQESEDPAVAYYVSTLSYLPKGSQRSDTCPKFEWHDNNERRGEVVTAAGTCLGFIEWYPNGAWGIDPHESGLAGTKAVAWSHLDAAHFLVNRLTRQVVVTSDGISKSARLVTKGEHITSSSFADWTDDVDDVEETYDLEFWNNEHGLRVRNSCGIEIPADYHPGTVTVLEGVVTDVLEQKVVIRGSTVIDVARRTAQ